MTSALRWVRDGSHFNVSLIVQGKVSHENCESINHNFFEEEGEPEAGSRTCVLPLTSRTPYRQAKPADRTLLDTIGVAYSHDTPRLSRRLAGKATDPGPVT